MAKHILILCSNPEVVQRLRATLEPQGYGVTVVAANADVAQKITQITEATGSKLELVILAPGSEDEEVRASESWNMKRLGENCNLTRPRVIVLMPCGYHGGLHAYRTGGDMYLLELFQPQELLAFVHRLIGRSEE